MPVPETDPTSIEGVRYIVTGRVQGVGYRAWTLRRALRHGVLGTVRNLPDGGVQIDAAADPAALEAFRKELFSGPSGANVASVTALHVELPATNEFAIAY